MKLRISSRYDCVGVRKYMRYASRLKNPHEINKEIKLFPG